MSSDTPPPAEGRPSTTPSGKLRIEAGAGDAGARPVAADLLFVNGTVLDGRGGDGRTGLSVAVCGDRLRVLAAGTPVRAARTFDAAGKFVCPGFIDIHSHSDFASLVFPLAQSKVLAGVTTEINGNCGMSAFPLTGTLLERRRAEYARSGLNITWTDAAGYLEAAGTVGSSINRGMLVGHGNLRASVIGWAARPADAGERAAMRRLLEEALDAGSLGLSAGLAYAPGLWADRSELAELCAVVRDAGGFFGCHLRNEDDTLLEAVDEFFGVVRDSGVRGQLSHVKTALRRNWGKIGALSDRLHRERESGTDFAADRYPYTALCTALDSVLLPPWATADGPEAMLARLADPGGRARILEDIRGRLPTGEVLDGVVVSSVHNDAAIPVVGRSLRELGALRGCDPLTAALDLLTEEGARVECIHFALSEDNLEAILRWPFTMIGSDHSVRAAIGPARGARPHPRAYGTPARFLTEYVRHRRLMGWGEAVRRMTHGCAVAAGLHGRGVIDDDAFADLVVFDPVKLADHATYEDPRRPPTGIEWVVVNGQVVVERGRHSGRRPGRMLLRGG